MAFYRTHSRINQAAILFLGMSSHGHADEDYLVLAEYRAGTGIPPEINDLRSSFI